MLRNKIVHTNTIIPVSLFPLQLLFKLGVLSLGPFILLVDCRWGRGMLHVVLWYVVEVGRVPSTIVVLWSPCTISRRL